MACGFQKAKSPGGCRGFAEFWAHVAQPGMDATGNSSRRQGLLAQAFDSHHPAHGNAAGSGALHPLIHQCGDRRAGKQRHDNNSNPISHNNPLRVASRQKSRAALVSSSPMSRRKRKTLAS